MRHRSRIGRDVACEGACTHSTARACAIGIAAGSFRWAIETPSVYFTNPMLCPGAD
jgi:hypothetical protein